MRIGAGSRRALVLRSDLSVTDSNAHLPSAKLTMAQTLYAGLLTLLRRFDFIDPSVAQTTAAVGALSADITALTQGEARTGRFPARDLESRLLQLRQPIREAIDKVNRSDLIDLASGAFEAFEHILEDVNDKPPSSHSLLRDHRAAYKHLTSSIREARNHLADDEFDLLKTKLQVLRADVSHQYESFFRLSQIDKSRKITIVDESRRCLDKLLGCGEVWSEIGEVPFPPQFDELAAMIHQLCPKRQPSPSMIPRPSPILRGSSRNIVDEPEKTGRTSKSARSASVAHSHVQKPDVQPTPAPRPVSGFSSAMVSPRPQNRRSASVGNPQKTSVVTPRPVAVKEGSNPSKQHIDRVSNQVKDIEPSFRRHNAALDGNEQLARFLAELRATGKKIEREPSNAVQQFAKLRSLMKQIDDKMAMSNCDADIQQKLREAKIVLVSAKAQCNGSQTAAELDGIIQQFGRLQRDRTKDVVLSRAEFSKMEEDLKSLKAENDRLKKARGQGSKGRKSITQALPELIEVQARMNAVQNEWKQNTRRKRTVIEAEFDQLLVQQADILNQLMS
jgi:hypothetical protein